jgi:hypothetical protein
MATHYNLIVFELSSHYEKAPLSIFKNFTMLKRILMATAFKQFSLQFLQAQSIAVGLDTPDPAAIMELESTRKGVLIPRLTTVQRNAIGGLGLPQEGLLIYNTTTDQFNYWDGTAWVVLEPGLANAWELEGNSGTVDGTNFIGTTDNIPFEVKVFDERAGRIDHLLSNAFWGYRAGLSNTTGTFNTALGSFALQGNTIGQRNIGLGTNAATNITTAIDNIAIGYDALSAQSFNNGGAAHFTYNVAIGNYTLALNQPTSILTGLFNTGVGDRVLYRNTIGDRNTAIGARSMFYNLSGRFNTALGVDALRGNTVSLNIANFNVAVGGEALFQNGATNENVAVGYQALRAQTFFNGGVTFDSRNTAIGSYALFTNNPTATTNGINNTAVGFEASRETILLGTNNTSLGVIAMRNTTTGSQNTALGYRAMETVTTGSNNTAVGSTAMQFGVTNNVLITLRLEIVHCR